jgi:hypothetical protein
MPSIKLSITVGSALAGRYGPDGMRRVDKAIATWIAADARRGIETTHVAVDDAPAMRRLGVRAVSGRPTATKVKRALDTLCRTLVPDYIVILGGHDIVPMFVVPNPSFDPDGDDDADVLTDNPYACSTAYRARTRASYLVPDRVVGRIPDLPGDADTAWLTTSLRRAAAWKPKPPDFYDDAYAVVCDEWRLAGNACMRFLGLPGSELQVSPPTNDATRKARGRLGRTLHMIKCHGALLDARFYGQSGLSYPEVLLGPTLESRLTPGTLAAAMCCYGAQVFSPADRAAQLPGTWPIATTYLRKGAVGFAGATRIAWVGIDRMMCADWIVCAYLRAAREGASLGRALLEAKQDYVEKLSQQGQTPDTADEKTLIEFVLLGDPSLHPVAAQPVPAARRSAALASPLAVQERSQRRALRAATAVQLRKALPERQAAAAADAARARRLFKSVAVALGAADASALQPARAKVQHVVSPTALPGATPAVRGARATRAGSARESLEYYWTSRTPTADGRPAQIRLLKVETDIAGNIVRTRLLHAA